MLLCYTITGSEGGWGVSGDDALRSTYLYSISHSFPVYVRRCAVEVSEGNLQDAFACQMVVVQYPLSLTP